MECLTNSCESWFVLYDRILDRFSIIFISCCWRRYFKSFRLQSWLICIYHGFDHWPLIGSLTWENTKFRSKKSFNGQGGIHTHPPLGYSKETIKEPPILCRDQDLLHGRWRGARAVRQVTSFYERHHRLIEGSRVFVGAILSADLCVEVYCRGGVSLDDYMS
jgi:hypothetical protein